MKHTLLSLLAAIFLILPAEAAAPPSEYLKPLKSIVKIHALTDEGKPPSQCTAFAVNAITYITAYHCVEKQEEVHVFKENQIGLGIVYKTDKKNDLAMFRSNVMSEGLNLGSEPKLGDKLYFFGYPFDVPFPVFFEAFALGKQYIPPIDHTYFILNHPSYQGMSGGPVTNSEGGVVSVMQMGAPFISGGAEYEALKKFLK